ncbi:MAG: carboxymuconolactone decarboxylase family protein [Solirubrobacteraceae bacterium]|nr:carboxymuconolactone decarboxylase family protein [Solirubrobacteraceae bacterium]
MASIPLPAASVDRRWTAVRAGLALLGLGQGATALYALLAPRSFFADYPVSGAHWVAAFAPYNEHLIRDYGASFTAIAALALAAAWIGERRLVQVALAVWLVAAVPHLIFHVAHADTPPGTSGAASIATLALNVALPLALLILVPKESRP